MNDDDYDNDLFYSDRLGEILLVIAVVVLVFLSSCWPSQAAVDSRSNEYNDRAKVRYGASVRPMRSVRCFYFQPTPMTKISPWCLVLPYPFYLTE